jgi:hypothetical protein
MQHLKITAQRQFLLATAMVICGAAFATSQTLVNIAPNTGSKYGLTAWVSRGTQQVVGGNPSANAGLWGYGLNLKYGSEGMIEIDIDSTVRDVPCDECGEKFKKVKFRDTSYFVKVSFGAGYLSYFGFVSPLSNLSTEFDLSGPYAGLYFSFPLYFADPTLRKIFAQIDPDDSKASVSLFVGYTSAVFTPGSILGTYIGPNVGANPTTGFPVTFQMPTTVSHNVNLGLVFGGRVFIEWDLHFIKASSVLYAPLNGALPKDSVQIHTGSGLDLSFEGFKAGISFDF